MAKEMITKEEAINRIGCMISELDHFYVNQMYYLNILK